MHQRAAKDEIVGERSRGSWSPMISSVGGRGGISSAKMYTGVDYRARYLSPSLEVQQAGQERINIAHTSGKPQKRWRIVQWKDLPMKAAVGDRETGQGVHLYTCGGLMYCGGLEHV
jgi:hypothetical protein